MPSALIKPSLPNANKCPSSTWQLTIKVICFIRFLEHKNQRSQPAHRGNNHAVLLQEINRPFNMAINLQSGKKNRWQLSAGTAFNPISGCFDAPRGRQSYGCCRCYQQLTTSFSRCAWLASKLAALNSLPACHCISDLWLLRWWKHL